jgi:hypothetical protein
MRSSRVVGASGWQCSFKKPKLIPPFARKRFFLHKEEKSEVAERLSERKENLAAFIR